jgi:hypothetical protein
MFALHDSCYRSCRFHRLPSDNNVHSLRRPRTIFVYRSLPHVGCPQRPIRCPRIAIRLCAQAKRFFSDLVFVCLRSPINLAVVFEINHHFILGPAFHPIVCHIIAPSQNDRKRVYYRPKPKNRFTSHNLPPPVESDNRIGASFAIGMQASDITMAQEVCQFGNRARN